MSKMYALKGCDWAESYAHVQFGNADTSAHAWLKIWGLVVCRDVIRNEVVWPASFRWARYRLEKGSSSVGIHPTPPQQGRFPIPCYQVRAQRWSPHGIFTESSRCTPRCTPCINGCVADRKTVLSQSAHLHHRLAPSYSAQQPSPCPPVPPHLKRSM